MDDWPWEVSRAHLSQPARTRTWRARGPDSDPQKRRTGPCQRLSRPWTAQGDQPGTLGPSHLA